MKCTTRWNKNEMGGPTDPPHFFINFFVGINDYSNNICALSHAKATARLLLWLGDRILVMHII